jgi:predicted membrane chloride channel (bestrophin family)
MSILIAYLGVSKVNVACDRYMECRTCIGKALLTLRELNQYCIVITELNASPEAFQWRHDTKMFITALVHGTVAMVKNNRHAQHLTTSLQFDQKGDPFEMIQLLRSHLFNGSRVMDQDQGGSGSQQSITANNNNNYNHNQRPPLQLFERMKMVELLHEFTCSYKELLRLASTPLPFALVQMTRTFVFCWVISLPLMLNGEDMNANVADVFFFVILLTYGFLGLEMVGMKMSNPFGDSKSNLDVKGMANATLVGMENDSRILQCHKSKSKQPRTRGAGASDINSSKGNALETTLTRDDNINFDHTSRIMRMPTENLDSDWSPIRNGRNSLHGSEASNYWPPPAIQGSPSYNAMTGDGHFNDATAAAAARGERNSDNQVLKIHREGGVCPSTAEDADACDDC